jgi:hypothetical protein
LHVTIQENMFGLPLRSARTPPEGIMDLAEWNAMQIRMIPTILMMGCCSLMIRPSKDARAYRGLKNFRSPEP